MSAEWPDEEMDGCSVSSTAPEYDSFVRQARNVRSRGV